jgi:fumarate reductase flavoprotein subunit
MKIYEADVAVVAGGPAGLAAANAAAENGVKVILLEKTPVTGGAGNMGMGPFAVGTRLQRKRMIGLTKEEAFEKFMSYTHWRADAGLVKAYIEKSASTIEWLQGMGVQFADVERYFPGSEATWHMVKPPSGPPGPRAASVMMKLMTERAEELGVKILLETPAKNIVMENGRVAGVLALSKSGEEVKVIAKAVIIATGGFGDNPEMIREYIGYEWGKDLFSFRIPGVTGEGIRMAWEAGAGSTEMNIELTFGNPDMGETPITDMIFHQPSMLCLSLSGERFMNEELLENITWAGNAVTRQQNRCAFAIFDSSISKYYRKNGLDLESLVHGDLPLELLEPELEKIAAKGSANVFVAESLEELAAKTGIPEDALKEAVETYNRGCQNKEDEFYKKSRYLKPLKGPKYFAGRLLPGGYGTLGGIKINRKTEALTKDYKVIPGLYAAGTDACSIYCDSYVFILPGNTMGFALNSGRIAGENAASYAEKS